MCPFCQVPPARVVAESELCVALRDIHPVSPGHTLVITRRHARTYFDASADEQAALWQLVGQVKQGLDLGQGGAPAPDGYNVGFNAGPVAGQTVMHVHIHVIPRYQGDVDDPRGGVRGVIPARQKYDASAAEEP